MLQAVLAVAGLGAAVVAGLGAAVAGLGAVEALPLAGSTATARLGALDSQAARANAVTSRSAAALGMGKV
jgi:hypothetical protein